MTSAGTMLGERPNEHRPRPLAFHAASRPLAWGDQGILLVISGLKDDVAKVPCALHPAIAHGSKSNG